MAKIQKKQDAVANSEPPQASNTSLMAAGMVAGASNKNGRIYGKSVLDAGFFYAPYIPFMVSPSIANAYPRIRAQNSPLEDLVEGVFEEEIKSGELKPLRKKPNYQKVVVNPKYYSVGTVANL